MKRPKTAKFVHKSPKDAGRRSGGEERSGDGARGVALRRRFRRLAVAPRWKGELFAGPRGAISVVRAFCMATGRVPVHIFDFHLFARECNVNRSMYMSTRATRYEAGSAYRMQPHIRSNARAVDRSLALKIRYSVSDGPRGNYTCPSVPRVGQISRQFHRTSSRSPKHATDGRSP